MDPSAIQYIVPLGNLGPWAHTLPTDHVYFYHHISGATIVPVTVYAPATGKVTNAFPGQNGEMKFWITVNARFSYYFDHVIPSAGVTVGATVQAGAPVGTSASVAFDFAVLDELSRQSFVAPQRYGGDSLNCVSPFPFFAEPVRSQLNAKIQRTGADLDGRINFDVGGTLAGNWFGDDLPISTTSTSYDISIGTKQVAFVRDVRFPDRLRVSLGGFDMTGVYGVPPEAPDFTSITPSSGLTVYRLLNLGEPGGPPGTTQLGLLLVQLTDATHLRIEAVADRTATTATFSAAAKTYIR